MFRTPALKLIVGLGAFSLAGILMYIHYKNKDDDDDEDDIDSIRKRSKKSTKPILNKDISMQLVLQNDKIPLIIGRGGSNLKVIEEKTNTKICFRDKDDNYKFCEIIGKKDDIYKAKDMISIDLNRSATISEELFVKQSVCGKILGRCGESIQEICRKSLAKVSIDNGSNSSNNRDLKRRIIITGTRQQVNIARKLIEEKIREDEVNRKEVEETELKREPRRSPTNSISSLHSSLTSLNSLPHLPSKERFTSNENEKQPFEVYVSAIASPAKFWLQLIGPQTKKLDELVSNMTEYYNCEENQNDHKIADPYLGQIVAALFKSDGKWYRAEIVGILPNEYNPRDVVLDLYFVDYGDSEYVEPHEVFELKTDFLTLRFQAIECYLAHVQPANDLYHEDNWDSSSISKFEELTHVASWKKLKSHIVTYKERPKGGNHIRREGSPVPGVELYDTIEGTEINIGHMLVSHGFATLASDYPPGNDVLRLGGGHSTNFTSYPTTTHNISYENITENQQQQQQNDDNDKSTRKQDEQIINGQNPNNGETSDYNKYDNDVDKSLKHPVLNGSGNNKPIKLTNSKTETDNFLQTEKTNGNNITKPTTNDKKWKQLIS